MERLKNKTLLIGRDPAKNSLLLAVKENNKSTVIGSPGSVPKSVSRCRPAEGVAHVKIEIDDKGEMLLYNMNPNNSTYVEGNEISIKRITGGSNVELGQDRYRLNIPIVLEAAKRLIPSKPLDISHLKGVWKNFEEEDDRIALRQQEMSKKRMLPIMVSSTCGILSGLIAVAELNTLWVSLPLTMVVSVLYFKNYNPKDTSHADKKNAVS